MVTNNTMLLFARLYNASPNRFQDFLSSLLSEENIDIQIGLAFKQQTKAARGSSIPDGSLSQPSFKLLIETKLYDNQDRTQLKKHLMGFERNQETQILLLINPSPTTNHIR